MRSWSFACLVCTLVVALSSTGRTATAPLTLPSLDAAAYLLIDAQTGQVLAANNQDRPLSIASTTKIMTAILALERGNMADVVTVSPRAASIRGTSMYLTPGEQQPLIDLLHGMMLVSANDAAAAIAEHLGGTEANFVLWMNAKAKELGATQTSYANAYGFDHVNHFSTATDLALIARYAMTSPVFMQLVATPARTIGRFEGVAERRLTNRNPLLSSLDGALGIKNGYTRRARYTYVAAARRGDMELIAVVLGTENSVWSPARQLLEYGFRYFERHLLLQGGQMVGLAEVENAVPVPAVVASDLSVLTLRGSVLPEVAITWAPGGLTAPVMQGQRIGQVEARSDWGTLGGVSLLAAEGRTPPEPVLSTAPDPALDPAIRQAGTKVPWLVLGLGGTLGLVLVAVRRRIPHRT